MERQSFTITRTNRHFLLKEMTYTQHFSHVYSARLEQLTPRLIESLKQQQQQQGRGGGVNSSVKKAIPPLRRILEVSSSKGSGTEALLVGTLYKNMQLFRPFLREYTANLVRLQAGEDDEAGGGDDGGDDDDGGADDAGLGQDDDGFNNRTDAEQQDRVNIASDSDSLVLEDASGRIQIGGAAMNPAEFVTGVVVGIAGAVNDKGVFIVSQCFSAAAAPPVPRSLPVGGSDSNAGSGSVYIAFVCGLGITGVGSAPLAIEQLIDFLSGTLGDEETVALASRIGRVVIGGELIVETEEAKLTKKTKLEPNDHARLTEVASGKSASHSASCAGAMRHVDTMLSTLGRTVPVEVMPGSGDPTNCFLPQQPIHPIMLLNASRQAHAMRLVTNPFSFDVNSSTSTAAVPKTSFLVTSGQNVTDITRQSRLDTLGAMSLQMRWGHLCPTAPNTLPCFPFQNDDPFTLPVAPHCMVACCMPQFETAVVNGTRLISVPRFSSTGQIVLVDVASPTLEPKVITLTVETE